jgi:hypothetical protein
MQAPAVLGAGMAAAGEAGWRGARGGTGHRSARAWPPSRPGTAAGDLSLCPSVPSYVPLPSPLSLKWGGTRACIRTQPHAQAELALATAPRPLHPAPAPPRVGWVGGGGKARTRRAGRRAGISSHLIPPLLLHRVRAHTHVPRRVRICVREPASDGSCSPLHRTVGGSITILPTEGGICGALFQP